MLPVLGDGRIGRKGRRLRREWEPEVLIAAWTLLDGDWELVGNKTGATRLGFIDMDRHLDLGLAA